MIHSAKLLKAWQNMRDRCRTIYKGIEICPEWSSRDKFCQDMGEPPSPKHTLERKDNSKGYSKENCIWALQEVQNKNKGDTIMVELNGKTQCLSDWCRELGLNRSTIGNRIAKGMSPERALTLPIAGRGGWGLK